jgi:hypothetical protein
VGQCSKSLRSTRCCEKLNSAVVVTDSADRPVLGLGPADFKVLNNDQSRKILSFRPFDGGTVKPEPTVEVILVLDIANLPFPQVAFVRSELERFVYQNGGRLAQQASIYVHSESGLRIQPRPSVDGLEISKSTASVAAHLLEMYTLVRRSGQRGKIKAANCSSDRFCALIILP